MRRATVISGLAIAANFGLGVSSPEAETIEIAGTRAAASDKVRLIVTVSSEKNLGYIRQSSNYDTGQWTLPQAIPCGTSLHYFEVWSKRNFGYIPAPAVPGIPSGSLKAVFTLLGASTQSSAVVERSIKGTMKKSSHWKGQDFALRVDLTCNDAIKMAEAVTAKEPIRVSTVPIDANRDNITVGRLAENEYAEVTYISGRWYTHPHNDAGTNDPSNWHGPGGNGIHRLSGIVEGALFVQGVPFGQRRATQSKTFEDEKSMVRIDGPCFMRAGTVDDAVGDNTGTIKIEIRVYSKT